MKILYVSDVDPDPNSGASGTDLQTLQALRELGHSVDAVWRDELRGRIDHPAMHSLFELPRILSKAVSRRRAAEKYDIVIVNQPYSYAAAKVFKKSHGRGVFIVRSHGFEAHMMDVLHAWESKLNVRNRVLWKKPIGLMLDFGVKRACSLAMKYTDGVLVNSSMDKRYIEDTYGLENNRVAAVAQAAPQNFLTVPSMDFSGSRRSRLMVVGPYQFYKGVDLLVPAVRALLSKYENLTFTWVCSCNEHASINALFPIEMRARIDLSAQVTQSELMNLYDSCGIFLFPSLFEGFGKAPLEAMSRGLCVVSSKTGGMADIIESGKDGMLVEPGNPQALIDAVCSLVEDKEKANRIAQAAREKALKYSWHRTGHELEQWLHGLRQMHADV